MPLRQIWLNADGKEATMGLEMEFRDNRGRKHDNLESLLEAEKETLVEEAARNVEKVVRAQRCPTHGKTPSISTRKGSDGFSYTIDACCDECVEVAEQALEPY
ncbi:MAG TPA: hypothetical protein VFP17_12120, partial [Solirubrobacterales bacterium]|nr:hypothetical protein [Solirubrobacterales bacterium]